MRDDIAAGVIIGVMDDPGIILYTQPSAATVRPDIYNAVMNVDVFMPDFYAALREVEPGDFLAVRCCDEIVGRVSCEVCLGNPAAGIVPGRFGFAQHQAIVYIKHR